MKNKKNISFFILFLLYIIVFFVGYRYIGKDIFYASLPMIFGASVIYNYVIGFIVIVLNIPATIFLMFVVGIPLSLAVKEIDPFFILLQCIFVVIPSFIKIYNERKYKHKSREMTRKIEELTDEINDVKGEKTILQNEITELKLIIERYKTKAELDHLTGLLNREGIIRKAQKFLTLEEKKAYIFVYFNKLKSINITDGILKGDQYLFEASNKLSEISDDIGRISDAGFLIIENVAKANDVETKILELFGEDIEIMKKISNYDDRIDDIFRGGTKK